jgi:hypothetical protein
MYLSEYDNDAASLALKRSREFLDMEPMGGFSTSTSGMNALGNRAIESAMAETEMAGAALRGQAQIAMAQERGDMYREVAKMQRDAARKKSSSALFGGIGSAVGALTGIPGASAVGGLVGGLFG